MAGSSGAPPLATAAARCSLPRPMGRAHRFVSAPPAARGSHFQFQLQCRPAGDADSPPSLRVPAPGGSNKTTGRRGSAGPSAGCRGRDRVAQSAAQTAGRQCSGVLSRPPVITCCVVFTVS
ncbi:uncharacterized protein LOC124545409 [Schistocerca americana]|uniref:uncharacterized protein LOC124545409 n=1 Tax=Schistocerca americana TaxID=7009 RepID=UPI001F4FAE5A|nr:uncharacterized protein LOC124545409 [Schistocerca americana]